METINIKEARRRLSDLVKAAERGRSIIITRRGKEVARLGPAQRPSKKAARGLPDLAAFRATIKVKGKPLSQVVADMRSEERY